jgi:ankyrin repeat protein
VKLTLATLSKGEAALDDAYSEALERIEGQRASHFKLAKNVLTWITFAKRPLTTAELCCALAVEPGEAELDPENKPDVYDIVSVCAGLVVVDQESAIIRLVHYTTQEYFERISSRLNPNGQLEIAQTCLTYLSFSVFESGRCATDEEFEERLCQHELLDYAAKHYGEHIRSVDAKVAYLACTLVTQSGIFPCAAQVLFVPSYKYRGYSTLSPAVTGLHWIARFGLCDAAKEFLRIKEDETCAVNARDSNGEGSLLYAVKHGHCEMAELLLDKGANVHAQGGHYGNALYAASCKGHEAVVELLLDKGANVNTQGGHYGNALQAALSEGHEAVVKLLLDKGADVNAQGGFYGNALQAALFRGREAVIRLLLDKGADVNADVNVQDERYGNALQTASSIGHEAVVRLLLDKGADVNAQSGAFGNALQAAIFRGHETIVRLLLNKGVDVNAQGGHYGNALQAASSLGDEAIVRLLLDKGANVNAQGGYYGNALQAASSIGHEAIVRLLLDKGANVNAQGGYYGNALQAAIFRGHETVVSLLLNKGVNVNEQGGPYGNGNALHAAAYAGNNKVLERLIEKDSIRQLQDPYDRTLLWWAAAGGQTTTVQLLTSQYNYDSRVADKFGRTPLWIATKKGHHAVSELLSEECGPTDRGQTASSNHNGDSGSVICDVCTSSIKATDFHYHCRHCSNGDWDVCEDCRVRGAFCAEETHILVKRTRIDKKWVEMTC